MAASEADPESHDESPAQTSDNNLKPFFVLHRATTSHSEKRSAGKTRKKIDSSAAAPLTGTILEKSEPDSGDDKLYDTLRMQAFRRLWSKVDTTIKDVLLDVNRDVFNDINRWVHESFSAICSRGLPDSNKATCSYPFVTDVTAKLIFTGLLLTRNIEFVDDLQTFSDLNLHLKTRGCHVANLSSLDFAAKKGIGLCIQSLLRQFLTVSIDAADISILASWYSELGNIKHPVVVIIDDIDRCCGSVLSDFILMLSEWAIKIPIILLLGVATTCDAPRSIISSEALHHLYTSKFILGSPADRLDAIIEAVLVKQCLGFTIGHKVATFLRNSFLKHDGTLSSLTRALKMAIAQHLLTEPLSFISGVLFDEDGSQPAVLSEVWSKRAFELPSCKRYLEYSITYILINDANSGQIYRGNFSNICCTSVARVKCAEPENEILSQGLLQMKRSQNLWSLVILCLYEAGKNRKSTLLDLYNEALDPDMYDSVASDSFAGLECDVSMPSGKQVIHGQHLKLPKGGFIGQAIRQVRDLPAAALCQLIERWEKLTGGVSEIHDKVMEMQISVNSDGEKRQLPDASKRHRCQSNASFERCAKTLNEKVITLIHCMIREFMLPIECLAFHEIVCFKNVDKLQSALVGDTRRTIQVDLLESHKFLKCSCCRKTSNIPLPSMHDTSMMYILAQEHGDLINLHDWYQSFKGTILSPNNKGKQRPKQLRSPKKRKYTIEPPNETEASIQARFCRSVIELQITGLLRMPSKRRPDYVQRVAFGL